MSPTGETVITETYGPLQATTKDKIARKKRRRKKGSKKDRRPTSALEYIAEMRK